jgi:hypothetical protein
MWKLDTSERIGSWRAFRKTLDDLPFEQAVNSVVIFWQGCPFVPYYLDPDVPTEWPTPWELISENHYCDLAKALGMLYTLYFTTHRKDLDVEIRVYYDPKTKFTYNLAFLNQGKYVLNFRDDSVVNIESINKNLKLQYHYSSADLKLEEY